jgi:uncharacterized RDD family membrane protein YckC
MAIRRLSDRPLRVVSELLGTELASPMRRAIAFAFDSLILFVPSVAVALGASWLTLRLTEPEALRGIGSLLERRGLAESEYRDALKATLPLLVRHDAPGLPPAVAAAVEEGDLEGAADRLVQGGYDFLFSLNIGGFSEPELGPRRIRIQVAHLIPKALRAAALFGVQAVYFTLCTAWWGRTLGKRLAGIRVVRLDGHRLSLAEGLERFAGYLHIPGSLGTALLDLWRDPNRRMPHDRVVHTAVIRVRPATRRRT